MANCRSMGAKEICSLIVLILQLTVRSSYANPIKWKYVGRDGCVVQSGFVLDGRSHYDQLKAEIEHIQDAWVEHLPGLVTSYDRRGNVVRQIIQWPHVHRWRSGGCWMIVRRCIIAGDICGPGGTMIWKFARVGSDAKERRPTYHNLDGYWASAGSVCHPQQCPPCPKCPQCPQCP